MIPQTNLLTRSIIYCHVLILLHYLSHSDHIPLFDVCSKYLTVHQLDFSLDNVKRIMSKTVHACTRHMAVERCVAIRSKALALTRDNPFDGDVAVSSAMSELVNSCRENDANLRAVMCVIWHRLHRSKSSKHILLSLELLAKLISEGQLTAIIEAMDGLQIISTLKKISDGKNVDAYLEVRLAAIRVYSLLVDLPALFVVRRRIAVAKAEVVPKELMSWSNYIVSRLPLTVNGHVLHSLFSPPVMSVQKRIFDDDDANFDAVTTTALRRLSGGFGNILHASYPDREDVILDWKLFHKNSPIVVLESGEDITADNLFPDY